MPLKSPPLDDLTFQQIVNRTKEQIPRYCPEWTDHNVSDPGVTLIELFASMVEMLLYRVNRVPDQVYRAFLDLIGLRLDPARPAATELTFYVAGSASAEIVIREGTEVATLRTESETPIVFTTVADFTIRPVRPHKVFRVLDQATNWSELQRSADGQTQSPIPVFSDGKSTPWPGNGLYFALVDDHSKHVLRIEADCRRAGGGGAAFFDPPLVWEVSSADGQQWLPCTVESDGTHGFNRSGEIVLRLPRMSARELPVPGDGESERLTAHWLRCRLNERQQGEAGYTNSPSVSRLVISSYGGSIAAQHATIVQNEALGVSDGTPYQELRLRHAPLLGRDLDREHLLVQEPDRAPEPWVEVSDFAGSTARDRHYTLDDDGSLRFGPMLQQPDGSFRLYGATPAKGSQLLFSRYRYGGGAEGNVRAQTLTILKASHPHLARVTNWTPARGGRPAQRVEDAHLRVLDRLRTHARAVTVADYEHLAASFPGVARARCLTRDDLAQAGVAGEAAQTVTVVVLAEQTASAAGRAAHAPPLPDALLISQVEASLQQRSVIGVRVQVRPPVFVLVQASVYLRLAPALSPDRRERVAALARERLYRYLDPYTGGSDGSGWPFGRELTEWELKVLLQSIDGVDLVEQIVLADVSAPGAGAAPDMRLVIPVGPDAVICSGDHTITIVGAAGTSA